MVSLTNIITVAKHAVLPPKSTFRFGHTYALQNGGFIVWLTDSVTGLQSFMVWRQCDEPATEADRIKFATMLMTGCIESLEQMIRETKHHG